MPSTPNSKEKEKPKRKKKTPKKTPPKKDKGNPRNQNLIGKYFKPKVETPILPPSRNATMGNPELNSNSEDIIGTLALGGGGSGGRQDFKGETLAAEDSVYIKTLVEKDHQSRT